MSAVIYLAVILLGLGCVIGLLMVVLDHIDEAIDAGFDRKYQRLDDPLEVLTGVPSEDDER